MKLEIIMKNCSLPQSRKVRKEIKRLIMTFEGQYRYEFLRVLCAFAVQMPLSLFQLTATDMVEH
jgi:hypothetical protein